MATTTKNQSVIYTPTKSVESVKIQISHQGGLKRAKNKVASGTQIRSVKQSTLSKLLESEL